jgi:cytosine/uracil/thiamine/allantoin permease
MWKYIVAFVVFAGLALWMISKAGGDLDMGGEKHEVQTSTPVEGSPKK